MFTQLSQWKHKHESNEINTKYRCGSRRWPSPPSPQEEENMFLKRDRLLIRWIQFSWFFCFFLQFLGSAGPLANSRSLFQLNKTIYEKTILCKVIITNQILTSIFLRRWAIFLSLILLCNSKIIYENICLQCIYKKQGKWKSINILNKLNCL